MSNNIEAEGVRALVKVWKINIGIKAIVFPFFSLTNLAELNNLAGLNTEFLNIENPAQKYHLCRLYNKKITPQMQEFKQSYEEKAVPEIITILSAPIIYKDDAVLKQIITNKVNLFDGNVFTMIGKMLDKDALASFKMAIDDALAGQNNQSHIDEHGDEVKISGSHDSHNGDDF